MSELTPSNLSLAEQLKLTLEYGDSYVARRLLKDALSVENYELAEVCMSVVDESINDMCTSIGDVRVLSWLIGHGCSARVVDWLANRGARLEASREPIDIWSCDSRYSIIELAILAHNAPVLSYAIEKGLSFDVAFRAIPLDYRLGSSKDDSLYAQAPCYPSDSCIEVYDILYVAGLRPSGAVIRKATLQPNSGLAVKAIEWLLAHGAVPDELLLVDMVRDRLDAAARQLNYDNWRYFQRYSSNNALMTRTLATMVINPCFEVLLKAGADPDVAANDDAVKLYGGAATPLDLAALVNDTQLTELLMAYGAKPRSQAEIDKQRLHMLVDRIE